MSHQQDPVLYMKVTEALRAPDERSLAELAKTYNIADFPNLLILAVDLSPLPTVEWVTKLYEQRQRDFNETDPTTGNTALHIAVASNRVAIVRHLMALTAVDDTIPNKDGITAQDMANTSEMEETLQTAQRKFAEKTAVKLKQAFHNRDLRTLEQIYGNPRVSELLNINGFDPETKRTVLHDAAAVNDIALVKFILAHGGDPMLRDGKTGKLPQDLTTSDEIKSLLNNAAKSKVILDQTSRDAVNGDGQNGEQGVNGSGPDMEGYLKKWTNITSGYKLRYFKLHNGELSYYKRPEDAKSGDRLIRGSIGLRHAAVKLDSSEKNKFAIRTPSTKFHLKATHPAETNKWVWALQKAITFVRDQERRRQQQAQQAQKQQAQQAQQQQQQAQQAQQQAQQKQQQQKATSAASSMHKLNTQIQREASQQDSPATPATPITVSTQAPHSRKTSIASEGEWFVNDIPQKTESYESTEDDEEDDLVLQGPQISVESLISRLSAIKDLMGMLVFQVQDETMRDAITTAQGSIDVLSSDIVMLQRQEQAHLHKAKAALEHSENNQLQWARNYRDLEIHSERLEGQLYALRHKDNDESEDEFFDTMDNAPTDRNPTAAATTEATTPAEETVKASKTEAKPTNVSAATETTSETTSETKPTVSKETAKVSETKPTDTKTKVSETTEPMNTAGAATAATGATAAATGAAAAGAAAATAGATGATGATGAAETEANLKRTGSTSTVSEQEELNEELEEEEDVVAPPVRDYAKNAPGDSDDQYTTPPPPEHIDPKTMTKAQREVQERIMKQHSFAGYEQGPRQRLKIDADNRPRLSLWGILKNLIGKDMTKMTLPVTFNECTSLLQRSAEDMEYTELLDRAAEAIDDEGLRMVYVAAFAGSSYSSTINRVAKPFNPLLGETYEYARPDKGYRLFAEQVSHHPPIGALIAESRHWDFYGESNVESHFYGRSFDINPLGLWYLNLRPNAGCSVESELYSFRKITSSVVGIMLGNPVVDNYGEMEITNHTLGVRAVVNYKARGWRGSSAYKLQGKVFDKAGKELWTIGGQWDDKMYGMKAGSKSKILLWQVHERHRTPFNLTDFAVTLNALPSKLRPWLPPTDTRLRPDQRAMEEGRYDDAGEDKNRVEEKQRAARRAREAKGEKYKPQWFELTKHPVTGKDYYKPIRDYWGERGRGELPDSPQIF